MDSRREEIVGSVLLIVVAVSVLVGVGLVATGDLLSQSTGVERAPLVFFGLFVALSLFYPFQNLLAAEGWISRETWNDTLRSVLTLGLQLAFVCAGLGAAGMGYGLAAATVAVVPVAYYFLRLRPAVPTWDTTKSLWDYAKFSVPNLLVGQAYDRIDVLLIGTVLTAGIVGQYEVAFKLTVPAAFLGGVIGSGLMSKVSSNHSRGRDVAVDITNAVAYVSVIAIPIFFGALAIPEEIIVTSFGPKYRSGATLLVGIALYKLIQSQGQLFHRAISGMDKPNVNLKIDAFALSCNIVLGVALIYPFEAVGVVAASVVSAAVRYCIAAYALRQLAGEVEVFPRPLRAQLFAGIVMFVAIEALSTVISVGTWVTLIVLVGAGATVFGCTLLVVSSHFRLTVRSIWADAIS